MNIAALEKLRDEWQASLDGLNLIQGSFPEQVQEMRADLEKSLASANRLIEYFSLVTDFSAKRKAGNLSTAEEINYRAQMRASLGRFTPEERAELYAELLKAQESRKP